MRQPNTNIAASSVVAKGRLIDPQSVAFDFDSVVADTMHLFLKVAQDVHGINHLKYEDFTCYALSDCIDLDEEIIADIVGRLQEGRYSDPLEPISGAPEVLKRLGNRYGPLIFITARPHAGLVDAWLQETLALDAESLEIVPTGSHEAKTEELTRRGISFFVDDRLETCYALDEAGVVPVGFQQPWNRRIHPFMEVGSWSELEALMDW